MGNRIAKHIYTDNQFIQLEKSTYYVRDASGNVMAVYDRILDASEETGEFMLSERHIYGSSRIGMDVSTHVFGPEPYTSLTETTRELGHKQYEISNHLGNVLSVITDQKLPVEVGSLIVSYSAVVVTATDYSPFGVGLYGRSWSGEYRYGFNGMEDVTEFNDIDFSARVYSSHLARFRSIDPKSGSILVVSLSPYHFALNSPIIAIDANGEIWNIVAGVIAGAVAGVITAVVTDRDDPYYWQKVAAAGIGTAVGVATFGAAAPALIAGAGGAATIGTTGTLYINGLTSIGSAVIGAGVEQGILVVSGAQNEIDENEILMSGVLAIPELFLSKGADAMFKPALKKTQSKMVSSAVEAAQKSWSRQVREVANGIKKKYNLNRKTADAIAERIAEESLESEVQFVTWTAKLKTEGVLEIAVNIATEMSEMEFKEAVDSGRMNSNSSRMQSTVVAFDMKTQQE